MKSILKLDNFK